MKTIITTAAIALSLSAPAFADTSSAGAFFALSNDSAAERVIGQTSTGNPLAAARSFASTNTSAAELTFVTERARNVDAGSIRQKFALTNDSPAEN